MEEEETGYGQKMVENEDIVRDEWTILKCVYHPLNKNVDHGD